MATEVWELRGRSFRFGEGRVENTLRYLVTDAADEATAVAAINAVVPSTWNGLWFLNTEAEEEGDGLWRGSSNYGIPAAGQVVPGQGGVSPPPPPPPAPAATDALGPEWSFDTTGGTSHITTSLETRQAEEGSGFGSPPDTKLVIGASKNGEPSGCDIVVPKFEFQKTVLMEFVTPNYLRTLVDLTGKTNNATFLGVFLQGEVLYLGASGSTKSSEGVTVVHRFSGSPNKTGNGAATNPVERLSPNGHDYVWCTYEDEESNGAKVSVPASAFVERVYEEGDFDELGI
jgi:hypothetical protein